MKTKIWILCFMLFGINSYAQKKSTELKVASYNIRLGTAKDGENAWDKRKEKLNELINYHDFDIFGTQEGYLFQLKYILELNKYAFTGSGRDDGKSAGEHAAIFYKKDRYKLLKSGDFWFAENPDVPGKGWDATCCNRVCSWAKFRDLQTKKEFFVFNSHFDHQGVIARKNSAILLIAKIKEIAGDTPVICMGDLNSTPDTEQIQGLSVFLNDSFAASNARPYGPIGTFTSFKYDAPLKDRIDYIFVSENIKVLKYGVLTDSYNQKFPSDHMPVVVDIVVE